MFVIYDYAITTTTCLRMTTEEGRGKIHLSTSHLSRLMQGCHLAFKKAKSTLFGLFKQFSRK
jgi:hypothetical protein